MLKKLIVAGLALAIIGCAGEPKEQKMKASKAKETADAAKAEFFAGETYTAGVTAWTDAEAASGKKEFDKAKKGYMEAEAKFKAAAAEVPDAMAKMKEELTAKIAMVEEEHTKMMADKAMMKKVGMLKKDDKAKADQMMADCKADVAAAKEALAADDLMMAKEKLDADAKIHEELTAMIMPSKK
jgi:hypothetical protein